MEQKFKDVSYTEVPKNKYDKFPRIVILIVVAEFCERFSFSGMRAFLAIYLKSKLHYSDDEATEIYHTFSTLVYFFPVFGAILADSYLGKFKTILYMMCVYGLGNVVIAVTAIPPLQIPVRLFTMIGLLLIAVGTGGIKPCVAAFGGDQFKLPEQEKKLSFYFSVLYFNMAMAALVAKTVSPLLRSEIQCYGDKDCYSLAFGGPGILMAFSIVLFGCASSYYVLKKPTGNVVWDVVRCISLGLKRKFITKVSRAENSHWLDVTVDRFDQSFIEDIKRLLAVLVLYIPLPVFWALLDQLGSRWTLQASRMNGDFYYFTVKPDQMQVFCPIILLLIIPLFQKVLYPMLAACRILTNPLSKLTVGGILVSLAFVVSGILELYLERTYPVLPTAGVSQLRIFNSIPCHVSIQNAELNISESIQPFGLYEHKHIQVNGERYIVLELNSECVNSNQSISSQLYLQENTAVSYLLTGDLELNENNRYIDTVAKSRSGYPLVRFLLSEDVIPSEVRFYNERRGELEVSSLPGRITTIYEVFTSNYTLYVNGTKQRTNVLIETGGVYTILIAKENNGTFVSKVLVVTGANSVTMALLLPQFLIISMGEVLFCVTGMEFTFKESPDSMKSVLQGSWLLTEAFGNLLIIAVTRFASHHTQATQSFIYSGLMVVAIAVFYVISRQFKFTRSMNVEVLENSRKKDRSNSEVLYLQVKLREDCIDH